MNLLYSTKYLELKNTPSPDGKFDWVYANRPNNGRGQDAVVIAPILHDKDGDKILFLKTNRVPISAEGKAKGCIELPAGLVGDEKEGETIEEAIKKEMLEETGYIPSKITVVNKCVASSPGCVSETFTIAVADITDRKISQPPVSDGGVILDRIEVPIKDVNKFIENTSKEGYIISSHALSGLYYVWMSEKIS